MDHKERIEQMRQDHRNRQDDRQKRRDGWRYIIFFPLAILFMELVMRFWSAQPFGGIGLLYVLLFSVGAGMVCNLITSLGPERFRRALHCTVLILITLIFAIQIVHYTIFRGYAGFEHLAVAGDAISNFFGDMLQGIGNSALPLLLILFPLAIMQALQLWKHRPIRPRMLSRVLILAVVFHIAVIGSVLLNNAGLLPLRAIYREHFTINLATPNFGLMTSMRLDLRYTLFGRPQADLSGFAYNPIPPEEPDLPYEGENGEDPDEPDVYIPTGYNVLDIDFEALIEAETNAEIREMHQFFMNRRATPRNEWTGRFEGYNLIWLMGEAFHTAAIHPEIT
ncbi:MAG: hypothetical protein FWD84_06730, partial [Oscillospiraceae bacterium]|nr:hypothetical protein [Oscillospiraceae bacterium]